jgi:hypothetical protein
MQGSYLRIPATFLAKLILLTLITLTILVKSMNYEAPHYVVFSIPLSLPLPYVSNILPFFNIHFPFEYKTDKIAALYVFVFRF